MCKGNMQIARLVAALLLLLPTTAFADSDEFKENSKICADKTVDEERSIVACTWLLKSGLVRKGREKLVFIMRGSAYKRLGKYAQSIRDLDQVIRLDPDYYLAYYNRANAYKGLGQAEAAIRDYSRAIEFDRNFEGAYNNRGNTYLSVGACTDAIGDFNNAVRIAPGETGYVYNRGRAFLLAEDYGAAVKDFDTVLQTHPNHAFSLRYRSVAHRHLGHQAEASADLDKAIKIFPDVVDERLNKGVSCVQAGKPQGQ